MLLQLISYILLKKRIIITSTQEVHKQCRKRRVESIAVYWRELLSGILFGVKHLCLEANSLQSRTMLSAESWTWRIF